MRLSSRAEQEKEPCPLLQNRAALMPCPDDDL